LIDGTTLRAWLAERARGWREVVRLFVEAGQGLAAVHEAGVIHRDFKPDNVLVRRNGHVAVGDFGLARAPGAAPAARADGGLRLTRTGVAVGTPAYMSPEQHAGRPIDARSDQVSF